MNPNEEQKKADILETCAAIEHERWSDWMRHLFTKGKMNELGEFVLDGFSVIRWKRQMETSYTELSEEEKESDRRQVMRYMPLFESREQQVAENAAREVMRAGLLQEMCEDCFKSGHALELCKVCRCYSAARDKVNESIRSAAAPFLNPKGE